MKKDIYQMGLHEVIDLQIITNDFLPFRYIMRVPGGWVYANYDTDKDEYTDKLFVPYSNDMQKVEIPLYMKDLLTKLMTSPKTWERFVKYFIKTVNIKGYYDSDINIAERILIKGFDEPIVNIGIINQLLTSFCDGEGYYISNNYADKATGWDYIINTDDYNTCWFKLKYPSRQEAFNQGVVKAFSLTEERNK